MPGAKTNERPGTRAQVRYARLSASKARPVLDLIRGKDVAEADALLRFSERDAARIVRKLLGSAVANAEHNDGQAADELYVSACYADEGPTLKRWRPRARGRATRIRKRTSHLTIIVSRLPDEEVERRRVAEAATGRARGQSAEARRRRVARSRAAEQPEEPAQSKARADDDAAPGEAPETTEAPARSDAAEASTAADAARGAGADEKAAVEAETADTDESSGEAQEGPAETADRTGPDEATEPVTEQVDETTGDDEKGKA